MSAGYADGHRGLTIFAALTRMTFSGCTTIRASNINLNNRKDNRAGPVSPPLFLANFGGNYENIANFCCLLPAEKARDLGMEMVHIIYNCIYFCMLYCYRYILSYKLDGLVDG